MEWGSTTSREGEIYSQIGGDATNLLLLELLQKQNEQIQCQSEQLQKIMEAKEKAPLEENSYMFKKLANLHPPTYDGAPKPKVLEDWTWGMEKLFDALQCLEEWRAGFVGSYLIDEVDLWWATVRNRQYEPGFEWTEFKELLKNRFYLVERATKEKNEFYNEQRDMKRSGDQGGNHGYQQP